MNKLKLTIILDFCSLAALITVLVSLTNWQWREVHETAGIILVILIVVHLLLHLPIIRNIGKILKS